MAMIFFVSVFNQAIFFFLQTENTVLESDLSLIIEYSCDSLQSSPTQSRSSLRKEDEIILEFDPLMNNHLNDMPDEINRIDQNDSNDELLFKFVLSYHQKTNKFISTLQNFVGGMIFFLLSIIIQK